MQFGGVAPSGSIIMGSNPRCATLFTTLSTTPIPCVRTSCERFVASELLVNIMLRLPECKVIYFDKLLEQRLSLKILALIRVVSVVAGKPGKVELDAHLPKEIDKDEVDSAYSVIGVDTWRIKLAVCGLLTVYIVLQGTM